MKKIIFFLPILFLFSCQKDKIELSKTTDEIFYVKSDEQTLPVRVKGNSESKVFVLYIHGGPGDPGIWEHNTEQSIANIQPHYAAVFFDQPFAGFSQGNNLSRATVSTFTNSVQNVTLTLKHRFGDDISLFLLGHSWGGFVSAAYLSTDNLQDNFKGWINISGAHNYILGDSLVGEKIKEVGTRQIAIGDDAATWQSMMDWIDANPPNGTSKRSNNINSCGFDAMNLISDSTREGFKMNVGKIILGQYQPWAFTSWISNLITTNLLDLNQLALDNEMTSKLPKITIPVLNIYGKYDFIVPSGLGDDVMDHVGSSWKKMVIMNKSDHNPQLSEPIETHQEIRDFIEMFK
jgi:pimeloyl-ACP methyl ester carboxylesterase